MPGEAPAAPVCHPGCVTGGQPPATDVTGEYTGTTQSDHGGHQGTFLLSLQQSGATVTGTMSFTGGPCFSVLQFSGAVTGSQLCGAFTDDQTCLDIQGTASESAINGTYMIEVGITGCQGDTGVFSASPTQTPSACVGDCNTDAHVTVDEILRMVNITLGNADVSVCRAGDANHDGQITIDEILRAVNNALNGCAASQTATPTEARPTATPTANPTPTPTNSPTLCSGFVDEGDGTIFDCTAKLAWEKKGDDGSLHDKDFWYLWAGSCSATTSRYCQPSSAAADACAAGTGSASTVGCAQCPSGETCNCYGTACNINAENPSPGTSNYTTVWQWLVWLKSANFAGHNDWRMPRIDSANFHDPTGAPAAAELETFIRTGGSCGVSPYPPCVPPEFNTSCTAGCPVTTCSCTQSSSYWSATTSGYHADSAWFVNFNDGKVDFDGKASHWYVRAVRGGS
jgi:hypothetical protein